MAKKKFERNKEHLNIGTIGHVDHGKTTLSAALTAVSSKLGYSEAVPFNEIDNAPEERKRGITIQSKTIEFDTAERNLSLTDCPGHIDYIKNMITGASQADVLILVIAATDGKMQQTIEHILLAKQLGVKQLIIFINKVDALEDEDLLELVKEEAEELGKSHGFSGVKIVSGSALGALNGEEKYEKNIQELMEVIDKIPLPKREVDEPFLAPVEGVHLIPGRGTVVTSKIEKGVIKVGDKMEVLSRVKGTYTVTITGIEMFNKELDQGQAGDNVGLLLRGVSKEDVARGDLIVFPGSIKPHKKFRAEVYILTPAEGGRKGAKKKAIKVNYRPQFFMRTADITGTLTNISAQERQKLEKKDIAMPGDNVTLDIELIHEVGMEVGLKFTIREGKRTIGAGVVTEIIDRAKASMGVA